MRKKRKKKTDDLLFNLKKMHHALNYEGEISKTWLSQAIDVKENIASVGALYFRRSMQ